MTNNTPLKNLDHIFEALASKHRRAIVHLVSLQPFAIHELAKQRKLSLPAIYKHIKVLEKAGLVIRRKTGKTNYLSLNRSSLQGLQAWVLQYNAFWGSNSETLANYTNYLDKK